LIKNFLKKGLATFGIGIYRQRHAYMAGDGNHLGWLQTNQIKSVIDIGANDGRFAIEIREKFPGMNIYSFEPLREPYQKLVDRFKKDAHFFPFNCAIGEKSEKSIINRNEFHASSSLLPLGNEHKLNFPTAVKEFPEEISVYTFNEVLNFASIPGPYLVKIDVQGYEKQVIRGSYDLLMHADCLLVEVSFRELYQGQSLFPEIYTIVKGLGFEYNGAFDVLRSPIDGQVLQEDAIFLRKK
jgi:FkbM family methyltransferase